MKPVKEFPKKNKTNTSFVTIYSNAPKFQRKTMVKVSKNLFKKIIKEELSRLLLESEEINKFAKLRELLVKPNSKSWSRIIGLFLEWEIGDETLELALDYAKQHLDTWPDSIHLDMVMDEDTIPIFSNPNSEKAKRLFLLLKLCDTINMQGLMFGDKYAKVVAELPLPENIVRLNLRYNKFTIAGLNSFMGSNLNLKTVDVSGNDITLNQVIQSPYIEKQENLERVITNKGTWTPKMKIKKSFF